MFENILTELLLLLVLGILVVINTVLGTLIANKKSEFNWRKFGQGILKAFVIALCIGLFCLCVELVPVILTRVDINIPGDLITVFEVLMVSLTAYKKYAADCFEKMKIILNVNEEVK